MRATPFTEKLMYTARSAIDTRPSFMSAKPHWRFARLSRRFRMALISSLSIPISCMLHFSSASGITVWLVKAKVSCAMRQA